jgi:hypothetical protein
MPLNGESRIAKPTGYVPMGGFAVKFDDYALD